MLKFFITTVLQNKKKLTIQKLTLLKTLQLISIFKNQNFKKNNPRVE